jgi:hypothetical protein
LLAAFDRSPSRYVTAFYATAFLLYLLMIYLSIRARRVANWNLRPDLDTLRQHAHEQNEASVRAWVAEECGQSIATNRPKLQTKAHYVGRSLTLLLLVAVMLSIAAVLELVS